MRRGLVVLLLCLACGCSDSGSSQAPGATASCAEVKTVPIQGGTHLIGDSPPPVPYNSTPPTSGWHTSGGFATGARSEALTEPEQVSALEAGAAVVTYNGLPPDEVELLEETVTRDFPRRVVTTPYDRLGEGEVAFTAWGTLQRCDALDVDALATFVSTYADPEPATLGDH
jgi:hypothetical protein